MGGEHFFCFFGRRKCVCFFVFVQCFVFVLDPLPVSLSPQVLKICLLAASASRFLASYLQSKKISSRLGGNPLRPLFVVKISFTFFHFFLPFFFFLRPGPTSPPSPPALLRNFGAFVPLVPPAREGREGQFAPGGRGGGRGGEGGL